MAESSETWYLESVPYRLCRRFTVESGHMLSKHAGACRFPHGHTRTIEVVLTGPNLDENGMLVDFKAVKLALTEYFDRYDHSMAVNSTDPFLPAMKEAFPSRALVVFDDTEPTTEVIAKDLFDYATQVFAEGFEVSMKEVVYTIPPGKARVERVRVWETPASWAEYGID